MLAAAADNCFMIVIKPRRARNGSNLLLCAVRATGTTVAAVEAKRAGCCATSSGDTHVFKDRLCCSGWRSTLIVFLLVTFHKRSVKVISFSTFNVLYMYASLHPYYFSAVLSYWTVPFWRYQFFFRKSTPKSALYSSYFLAWTLAKKIAQNGIALCK